MTGIDDVAREVGVSTATVSRALRGLPRVSDETRSRVLDAALRLGYVPSPQAAGLASGHTRTVAVIVPYVTRWFFASVIQGAEQVLREAGYDLLLYNLAGDYDARHRVFQTHLLTKRVDAVLILALTPTPQEREWLARFARPVAIVGVDVSGWSSVRIDDGLAARTAVEHLIGLGHRRIAYVGGTLEHEYDARTPLRRLQGYRAAMESAGLEVTTEDELDGLFTVRGGLVAGTRLLSREARPTAVFAASDEMAIGVLHAARQLGLRVPDDVSVVGIDDHEMSEFFDLTTVSQPVHEQGRIAALQVVEALGRGDTGGDHQVIVPTRLIRRASTGPPPAEAALPDERTRP